MADDIVRLAAQAIASARRAHHPLQALSVELQPKDEAAGSLVQRAVHDLLAPDLGHLVGYKIGCTSKVMQDYLGIPHPCAGGVFAHGVHETGVVLHMSDFIRVGVECEIAVRLDRDLPASAAPYTAAHVQAAIGACYPAIEIVDDRYARWEDLGAPTLIADDFFAAGCVLGAPVAREVLPDLLTVRGRALINHQEVGQGTGADVLGHPYHALAWLANHLASEGRALLAGQIVLTGSLVKTIWLEPGRRVVMELDGLGTVAAEFN